MDNNNSIQTKFGSLSVEESAIDQSKQEEMEARSNNRRMCNELLYELCNEIPIVKTSERILLTAHKMYAYLEPRFSKMRLIYYDAISYLKTKLDAKKKIEIMIDQRVQNNAPFVVINQEQSNEKFDLETNQFCIRIRLGNYRRIENDITVFDIDDLFENAHLLYFLRLIAPLLQPIRLYLNLESSDIFIERLVQFLNAQSEWIDSIKLWDRHFDSEPIYGALSKYNKLQIVDHLNPVNVPKMINWLINNNNNNGQSKKCLFLHNWLDSPEKGTVLLVDELKKEFKCATSKHRFFVRLKLRQPLDEFTLCNELTGEKLELRLKKIKNRRYTYTLSQNNKLADNENAELDTFTDIYLER